jgi:hypothetical protein
MTTTMPAAQAPSLFFTDARACKAWLADLAVTNVAQALSTLLDALRVFNRSAMEPLERLKCLEMLRDRIAFVLGEQRQRQLAKSLPLPAQDAAAWSNARMVIEEMESGYRRCLAEPVLAPHAALVMQRIVRHVGAQMLLHALAYRRFDASLWTRLHQQYAAAEKAGLAGERVKDSLEGEAGASSVMEAYARVVLLQAAGLHEMTAPQVAFAEALLQLWIRKVQVLAQAPAEAPTSVCPLVVDLDRPEGAQAVPRDAIGGALRVIDAEGLARSLRRRIRALQAGDDVATLGLPVEAGGVDALHALQRLAKRWCEPAPREAPRKAPGEASAGLAFGLADLHFFLAGGKAFEQPGQERELSRQEKEDIAVFGRVTQRTQSLMAPAQGVSLETWDVVDEAAGSVRLRRRAGASKGVAVGRLVGLRFGPGASLQVGSVRALYDEPEGLVMTVALFPGKPEPTAVRGPKPPWSQGLLLPEVESLGAPASVVVPTAMAFRGRALFVWRDAAVEARVVEVLERGADFDRVTVSL